MGPAAMDPVQLFVHHGGLQILILAQGAYGYASTPVLTLDVLWEIPERIREEPYDHVGLRGGEVIMAGQGTMRRGEQVMLPVWPRSPLVPMPPLGSNPQFPIMVRQHTLSGLQIAGATPGQELDLVTGVMQALAHTPVIELFVLSILVTAVAPPLATGPGIPYYSESHCVGI